MSGGAGSWEVFDGTNPTKSLAKGVGIDSLKGQLPDDACRFAVYTYDENWIVRLHWKGPNTGAMAKVKSNGQLEAFAKSQPLTKVTVEVLAKGPLTHENIWDRVKPGSGSKVIDDL